MFEMESKKMSNLLENSTIALLPFARKTLVGRWSVNKEAIWNLLNSRGNPSTTTILSSVSSLSTSITVKGTAKIVKMTVFYTEEPEWRIASTDEPISTFAANVLTLLTSLPCTNKWKFVSLKDRSIIRIFCVPIYLCLEVSCDKRPKWKICDITLTKRLMNIITWDPLVHVIHHFFHGVIITEPFLRRFEKNSLKFDLRQMRKKRCFCW